ncbi:hypothetical protein TREMEDRAFT_64811 [Tremella mesenterica DSM 1558]|uniref:uncharacterized protein n=1 Tax=Tremella mesenterica (strain ATCC 24925 / CBS 8224 / DSM 1558 / NBRC 9311 / NRRL Y-6157 / RJB 2259-6 / UBC 559-6) TaxID=578456 RepID=UPI0003F49931|nr:uncharacterized protein TREMEDRAFT_64811 [Tremella mesenterica DSM 1558]EIW66952.1 hypothetical protein TREMEDRAFT_64811 [Tremella mesenterica DSM 1558]
MALVMTPNLPFAIVQLQITSLLVRNNENPKQIPGGVAVMQLSMEEYGSKGRQLYVILFQAEARRSMSSCNSIDRAMKRKLNLRAPPCSFLTSLKTEQSSPLIYHVQPAGVGQHSFRRSRQANGPWNDNRIPLDLSGSHSKLTAVEYWLSLLEGQTIIPSLEQGEAFKACYVLLKALSREKSDTTWSNELERRLDDMSTDDKALLSYTRLVQTMIEESLGSRFKETAQIALTVPGQINDTSTACSREDIESENDSDDSDVTVKAAESMKGDRQESS